jgi:hypothetical protein
MANRDISVGVKIDGNAKGFKSAADDAKRASQQLRDKMKKDNKDGSDSFGGIVNSLRGIPVAILGAGGVTAALSVLKTGMSATGEGADKLEQITGIIKGGYEELSRAITNLDFSNFLEGIKMAALASSEFIGHLDSISQRISDFTLLTSRMQGRVGELKLKKSMGTISKAESLELVKLLDDQFKLEQKIYEDAAEDVYDYIQTKLGLDKELFKGLQQGVEDRAKLSRTELEDLTKVNEQYAAKVKELKKQFPNDAIWITNALGQPKRIKFASEEYNKAIEAWIKTLSGAELAQLTEDSFLNETQWQQLIAFYKKRNDLTNEYALLENKAYKAGVGKGSTPTTGHDIEPLIPYFDSSALPSLNQIDKINKLVETGSNYMAEYQNISLELENVFTDLFSAGMEGWDEFGNVALQTIKRITAELLAKAAIWTLLNILTEGGFGAGIKLGDYLIKVGSSGFASAGNKLETTLRGRDIYIAGSRYNNSLIKNT